MITATGIQDQELAIAAKRASVSNPPFAGGGNLGAGTRSDRLPLLGSTDAVGPAEVADFHAVNRLPQVTAHRGESDRRRKPARVLERREGGTGCILFDRARLGMRAARCRIERRFELGDEVLEAFSLTGELGGARTLGFKRLFGLRLLLLALVDQKVHAQ